MEQVGVLQMKQDWPSVENIELYEQWRNPMRQVVQFFFKCYSASDLEINEEGN